MRRCLPLLSTWCLLAVSAGAAVLDVPAQFPTIQAAITAASSGDTVQVAPGLYHENLILKAGVTLKGAGWQSTIIEAQDPNQTVIAVLGAEVASFAIEGFTVRGANQSSSGFDSCAIFVNGQACCSVISNGSIRDCRLIDNGYGIYLANLHGGTITIERNQILQNLYTGIDPYLGTTIIRNNTIAYNGISGYNDNAGGGFVLLENNVVAFNGMWGIRSHATTPITVQYNDVFGNATNYFQSSGAGSGWNPSPGLNVSVDPVFADGPGGDVHLAAGTPCIDAGNPGTTDPDGSIADLGFAPHDPTYVAPSAATYGTGCAGLVIGWSGTPWLGSPDFGLTLAGAQPVVPAVLLVGASDSSWQSIALPYAFGPDAPGCFLNAAPHVMLFGFTTDNAGRIFLQTGLPDVPALAGVLVFLQWAAQDAQPPIGWSFSNGLALVPGG